MLKYLEQFAEPLEKHHQQQLDQLVLDQPMYVRWNGMNEWWWFGLILGGFLLGVGLGFGLGVGRGGLVIGLGVFLALLSIALALAAARLKGIG